MFKKDDYRKPFLFAAGFHVVLFIFLFIHFASKNNQPALQQSNIINAVTISQSQLQALTQPLAPAAKPQPPTPSPSSPQQQVEKLQVEKAQQQKIIQQQKAAQQAKLVAQQKAAQQAQQEKVKQQDAQRKKLIAQQIQQQLTTQVDAAQAKQQAQAKQKQLQAAKLAAQQMLQQEVSATDSAQQAAANQGEIDKYKALILQAISSQWIVPSGAQDDEVTKLTMRLAPGGMVLSVTITQSSGDAALDRSARVAVLKASPLPVPADPAVFASFRTINLTVKPQGISAGE